MPLNLDSHRRLATGLTGTSHKAFTPFLSRFDRGVHYNANGAVQRVKTSWNSRDREEVSNTDYISERVVNISKIEALIRSAYYGVAALRSELEKENPSMLRIDELSKQAHLDLLQAKDFEFCVERRRTKCPDD